jgi:hypothetical protein
MLIAMPYVARTLRVGSKPAIGRESREGVTGGHVLRSIGCRVGGGGGRARALVLLLAAALAVTLTSSWRVTSAPYRESHLRGCADRRVTNVSMDTGKPI